MPEPEPDDSCVPVAVSLRVTDTLAVPEALAVGAWLCEASRGGDDVADWLAVAATLPVSVPDAEPLLVLLGVSVSEAVCVGVAVGARPALTV